MSFPPLGRLSTRRGLPTDDDVLHEGVPEHLQGPLHGWAMKYLGLAYSRMGVELIGRDEFLEELAARYRVPVRSDQNALLVIRNLIYTDPEQFLDVVDGHLQVKQGGQSQLDKFLTIGGSAWEVVDQPVPHLERRVSAEQRELYVAATADGDDAAKQLREAWAKVYGRHPDPSDAWDHAIKAVEFLLHPIVAPTNNKATLGSMLADLTNKPGKWTLLLTTSSPQIGEVEVLAGMLRLMWGNPDRHGSGTGFYRNPTPGEAEQIVGMAVLVVSWLRKNALQPATPPSTGP